MALKLRTTSSIFIGSQNQSLVAFSLGILAEFSDFTQGKPFLIKTSLTGPIYPKFPVVSHGTWFLHVYPVTQYYPWLRLVTGDRPTWTTHWTSVVSLHRPLLCALPQVTTDSGSCSNVASASCWLNYYYHCDRPIYQYGGNFYVYLFTWWYLIARFTLELPGITREFAWVIPFGPDKGNG